MDKIHGKCNNPYRTFNKAQKKICEDKERAAGADGVIDEPINLTELIENYRNFRDGFKGFITKVKSFIFSFNHIF